jgi:hypothetical protein
VRFTGATLLSFLFVATPTFKQTASANEKFVTEHQSNELSYSPTAEASSFPDTEELASEAQIEKNLVISQKSEAIIEEKQPHLIW